MRFTLGFATCETIRMVVHAPLDPKLSGVGGRDALEGKGPQWQPQKRLGRRLEEVAKTVGGGYCRLQMPLRLVPGVRETVAGHRLGALERGVPPPLPMHPLGGGGAEQGEPRGRGPDDGAMIARQWGGLTLTGRLHRHNHVAAHVPHDHLSDRELREAFHRFIVHGLKRRRGCVVRRCAVVWRAVLCRVAHVLSSGGIGCV